jgi:hypothetical protein
MDGTTSPHVNTLLADAEENAEPTAEEQGIVMDTPDECGGYHCTRDEHVDCLEGMRRQRDELSEEMERCHRMLDVHWGHSLETTALDTLEDRLKMLLDESAIHEAVEAETFNLEIRCKQYDAIIRGVCSDLGISEDAGCDEIAMASARRKVAITDLLDALIKVVVVADRRTDEFDAARAAIKKAEEK